MDVLEARSTSSRETTVLNEPGQPPVPTARQARHFFAASEKISISNRQADRQIDRYGTQMDRQIGKHTGNYMANALRLLQYAPNSPPRLHGDHGLQEAGAVLGTRG